MNEIHAIGCQCERCHAPEFEGPPEVIDSTARAELVGLRRLLFAAVENHHALRERVEKLERAEPSEADRQYAQAERNEGKASVWKVRAEKVESERDSARAQLARAMVVVEAARRCQRRFRSADMIHMVKEIDQALAVLDGGKRAE